MSPQPVIALLALLFASQKIHGQSAPSAYLSGDSTAIGKVVYRHRVNVSGELEKNGYTALFFNAEKSLYLHFGDRQPLNSEQQINANQIAGDRQGHPIYKIHHQKKLFFRAKCPNQDGRCIVSDTFASINWHIAPDTKTIGQFKCQKATGEFRGRQYDAWFSPDIPVPSGPFKLGGLPGLILEATTRDGIASFIFDSLELGIPYCCITPPTGKDSGLSYEGHGQALWQRMDSAIQNERAKGHEVYLKVTPDDMLEKWSPKQ